MVKREGMKWGGGGECKEWWWDNIMGDRLGVLKGSGGCAFLNGV